MKKASGEWWGSEEKKSKWTAIFASAVFSAASIVSFSLCSQVTSKPCKQHTGIFFFLFCVDYYPFILKGHWVSAEEIHHLALSVLCLKWFACLFYKWESVHKQIEN